MNLSIIRFLGPVLTRALLISFCAACAVLSPDGQETQVWAAGGTQDVLLEQEIEEQEMMVKRAFEAEEEESEWSQRAEASWRQIFQQEAIKEELKGIQLRNIECRTSLCQVELTPTDPARGGAAFEEDVGKLIVFVPWQGAGFGKIEKPGGEAPVAMIYMAREGHALPLLSGR